MTEASPVPLLQMEGIRKSFPGVQALSGVDLEVNSGEVMALVGENGAGKSTLIKVLSGAHLPDVGSIRLGGELQAITNPVDAQRAGVATVFQDLALFPHMDVFGNVAFGLRMQRLPRDRGRERVRELLALVEMTDYAQREVHELSGGERQRVALARMLVHPRPILLLDEPTSSLDPATRTTVLAHLVKRAAEGAAVLLTSHDEALSAHATRTLVFSNGQLESA